MRRRLVGDEPCRARPERRTVHAVIRLRLRRLLLGLAVVLVGLVGLARPASAHTELIGTDPAEDVVLAAAPTAITLTFGEGVETALGALRVFDATGKPVVVGSPSHPGGDKARVQGSLPGLGQGTFLVSYRVVSADGHPVQGSFLFSVGQKSQIQPGAAATLGVTAASRTVGVLFGISRLLVFASFLLMAGGFAFVVLFTPDHPRIRTVLVVSASVLIVASLATLVLQGAYASGTGLAQALKPAVWRATAHTAFGRQVLFRVAVAAVGLALGLVASNFQRSWWQMPALLLGPAGAATIAFSGHAHTGRYTGLGLGADLVHLVALAWWIGGLVVLFVAALGAGGDRALVARFSPLAFGCVAAVVVSGVAQSWRQVGSRDALSSTYGHLLIAKVLVVGLLLAAAALSRRTLHRWVAAGVGDDVSARGREPGRGSAVAVAAPVAMRTPSVLRRSVGAEVLLSVAVLAITAGLVTSPPAIEQVSKPFNVTLLDKGATANIVLDRARVGQTGVHLYVTAPGGALTRAVEARMELSLPSAGVQNLTVALDPAGPNHFTTENVRIPFKGRWQATVIVRFGEFESHTFTAPITIR